MSDEAILDAALDAFAEAGFEAMSLRSLSRRLGLAHGAINQRYGSKDDLFRAAVRHGFGELVAEIDATEPADERSGPTRRRDSIRAFLVASAKRPQLVRLMNHEGIVGSERLDLVFDEFIAPVIAAGPDPGDGALTTREAFFLIVHGAAAPFTLSALAHRFDADEGPLDAEHHAERMAAFLDAALSLRLPSD